jgi:peptidyl-prolyl cis-trans isomerase B (cyclophilin B)
MVSLIPTPGPTATPTPSPTPYAPSAAEGRPLAQLPLNERTGVYNTAPEMTIDVAKTYQATIATDKGDIVIDLDAKAAPMTVNNFVMLANLGYYDGMPIAFNDPGAYLVTGSPEMSPDSDAGYAFALEPAAVASDIVTGTLSMWAVADPVTFEPVASGSQVMVWRVIVPDNPGYFNSFGKVVEGMDVVDSLQIEDVIKTITVTEK